MWFFLAALTAISEAAKDIFHSQKRVRPLSPILKAWAITTASLPALGVVLFLKGIPEVQHVFWIVMPIHAVLMAVATVLYMRALTLGPLSVTQPILALTTVLLTVTNPLLTNDRVSLLGWIGVIAVGVGIYGTQHPGRDPKTGELPGFFSPFVAMMRQPGVVSKLGVAVIYSVTANLDKLAIEGSSGPFYLLVDQTLVFVLLGIVLLVLKMRDKKLVNAPEIDPTTQKPIPIAAPQYLLLGGSINATTILLHMWALSYVPVPFVIAVKRTSIIFTSLWGYILRKERAPHWYRILGMLLVVAGIAVMLIYGQR